MNSLTAIKKSALARRQQGGLRGDWRGRWVRWDQCGGFTMIELVVTMIIIGILAVAVLPRFASVSGFEASAQGDRLAALLGYTQKLAIAQRRLIYVDLGTSPQQLCPSASTTACTAPAACAGAAAIALPGGNFVAPRTALVIGGSLPAQLCFDALGSPWGTGGKRNAQGMLTVSDSSGDLARTIIVEAETGHVRTQ